MIATNTKLLRRVSKFGAIYGLVFGTLTEILLRLVYVYQNHMLESAPLPVDTHILMASYPFPWWYFPLLSFIVCLPVSVLVHYYLGLYIKSSIRFWLVTGLVGTFVFYLLTLGYDLLYARLSAIGSGYWQFAWSTKFEIWLYLLPSILIYSFFYGAVVKSFRDR